MLTDKSKKITFIVSFGGKSEEEVCEYADLFPELLKELGVIEYALAPHCLDTNLAGELKTPHIHCSCIMSDTKRLSTWLNLIADRCRVLPEAVSIEKLKDFTGAIRYLVHKDDFEKYQYSPSIIRSSIPKAELESIINAPSSAGGAISYDSLYQVLLGCKSMGESAKVIGCSYFTHYFRLIQCIWEEICLERRKAEYEKSKKRS